VAGILTGSVILISISGAGIVQRSTHFFGASAAVGLPAGTPPAAHAASKAISWSVSDGSFENFPIPFSANHGGIERFCVAAWIAGA